MEDEKEFIVTTTDCERWVERCAVSADMYRKRGDVDTARMFEVCSMLIGQFGHKISAQDLGVLGNLIVEAEA